MCGVIVVDAGRSRSTCHGRDAYICDHCHEYVITIRFSINCPTVIYLPTVCYVFEREASSENYGPRAYLKYKKKLKIYPLNFIWFYFILQFINLPLQDLILANDHRGDWQPPCLCWVKVFAFVCAGVVHEALRDSPAGSITLVLTEENTYLYYTASPLLFGENPNAAHK